MIKNFNKAQNKVNLEEVNQVKIIENFSNKENKRQRKWREEN